MTLPVINLPTFKTKIISTDKEITFRPYTVKEEKILLMAANSKNHADHIRAVLQIISNCVVDNIDVGKLKNYDVDWLWTQLTIHSISDVSEIKLQLPSGNYVDHSVDLNKVEIVYPTEERNPKIKITDDIGVTIEDINLVDALSLTAQDIDAITVRAIKSIWTETEVYDVADHSEEELLEFASGISHEGLEEINKYMEAGPAVVYRTQVTDRVPDPDDEEKKIDKVVDIELKGLADFF